MRKGVLVKVRGKCSSFAKVRDKYSFAGTQEKCRVIGSEIEEESFFLGRAYARVRVR